MSKGGFYMKKLFDRIFDATVSEKSKVENGVFEKIVEKYNTLV